MQKVSLPAIRLMELASVLDSLQPKDLVDLKSIRLVTNLVNDFKSSLKEYSEKSDALTVKQMELLKKYQEEFKSQGSLSEDESKTKASELDARFQKEVRAMYGAELDALEKEGQASVTVELGDEKFAKLKEVFEKHAPEKYLRKDILVLVADALGL